MFFSPRLYFHDKWILTPLILSILLQTVMWWYVLAGIRPSEEPIFLHYNIILGVDLIGEWWRLYLVPAAGLLVLALNYSLSFLLYNRDKFLSRLLVLTANVVHIFLTAATVLLVRINI